jgi:outer membrane protein OmpA-like peptidoglycan-associated protein
MLKQKSKFLFSVSLIVATLSLPVLQGCATPGKKTAVGAGAGAAAGALIGGLTGGWKGAAIGAAAGGLAGGTVGNYLDKQADELAKVAETKRTQDGILVKLKNDLLFDTGSAVLKPEAINEISKLGDILSKYPEDRIKVEGHTDASGDKAKNEVLSMRRAEAVKNVLIGRGVNTTQIMVLGMGQTKPVADNKSSKGRSLNRRVELHIDVPQQEQS